MNQGKELTSSGIFQLLTVGDCLKTQCGGSQDMPKGFLNGVCIAHLAYFDGSGGPSVLENAILSLFDVMIC